MKNVILLIMALAGLPMFGNAENGPSFRIDGPGTNGNIVVFSGPRTGTDYGFSAASLATTGSVAQVAADLATETNRAILADASKMTTTNYVDNFTGDQGVDWNYAGQTSPNAVDRALYANIAGSTPNADYASTAGSADMASSAGESENSYALDGHSADYFLSTNLVVQTTGTNTTDVMSQAATTEAIQNWTQAFVTNPVVGTVEEGDTNNVISGAAVLAEFNNKIDARSTNTVVRIDSVGVSHFYSSVDNTSTGRAEAVKSAFADLETSNNIITVCDGDYDFGSYVLTVTNKSFSLIGNGNVRFMSNTAGRNASSGFLISTDTQRVYVSDINFWTDVSEEQYGSGHIYNLVFNAPGIVRDCHLVFQTTVTNLTLVTDGIKNLVDLNTNGTRFINCVVETYSENDLKIYSMAMHGMDRPGISMENCVFISDDNLDEESVEDPVYINCRSTLNNAGKVGSDGVMLCDRQLASSCAIGTMFNPSNYISHVQEISPNEFLVDTKSYVSTNSYIPFAYVFGKNNYRSYIVEMTGTRENNTAVHGRWHITYNSATTNITATELDRVSLNLSNYPIEYVDLVTDVLKIKSDAARMFRGTIKLTPAVYTESDGTRYQGQKLGFIDLWGNP